MVRRMMQLQKSTGEVAPAMLLQRRKIIPRCPSRLETIFEEVSMSPRGAYRNSVNNNADDNSRILLKGGQNKALLLLPVALSVVSFSVMLVFRF